VTFAAPTRTASPFAADAAFAARMSALVDRAGLEVVAELDTVLGEPGAAFAVAGVLAAERAADIVERHGLGSAIELALLALPAARRLSRPPISTYAVAAVGIEAETGDLVFGGNLEFPGTELTTTIHAEGFVTLRARRRGHTLRLLAISEAHPCAHCRQTLSESTAADELLIVDPLGHRLSIRDLYPWPFRPAALGMDGDSPARPPWPDLTFLADPEADPPPDVADLLLDVGMRAHAPYSGAPSAVVLRLRDGRLAGAGCVESVAFNPSIGALQAALVELAAAQIDPDTIADAWLARVVGGPVDPAPGFRALLRAVAPSAGARVVGWRAGA
jgi:cytidine deaminase